MRPEDMVYVHIGSGMTPSRYYCKTCDGYFGVPHDDAAHNYRRSDCACVPCQKHFGRFPTQGTFLPRSTARLLKEAS